MGMKLPLSVQIKAARLPEPTPEFRFSDARKWRFDFAYPALRIAVEVDGGTHTGGRHVRGKGYEEDAIKLNEAALAGWLILRVTTEMVADGRALEFIRRALDGKVAT